MVCQGELGTIETCAASGECLLVILYQRSHRYKIVPAMSNGADAVNFRHLRESGSVDFEGQNAGVVVDDGLESSGEDLFGGFSSVTLKHDGE